MADKPDTELKDLRLEARSPAYDFYVYQNTAETLKRVAQEYEQAAIVARDE